MKQPFKGSRAAIRAFSGVCMSGPSSNAEGAVLAPLASEAACAAPDRATGSRCGRWVPRDSSRPSAESSTSPATRSPSVVPNLGEAGWERARGRISPYSCSSSDNPRCIESPERKIPAEAPRTWRRRSATRRTSVSAMSSGDARRSKFASHASSSADHSTGFPRARASLIAAWPTIAPLASTSVPLLAPILPAPWMPVAASPTAKSPATVERRSRSTTTPPSSYARRARCRQASCPARGRASSRTCSATCN